MLGLLTFLFGLFSAAAFGAAVLASLDHGREQWGPALILGVIFLAAAVTTNHFDPVQPTSVETPAPRATDDDGKETR
jgi:hypothetical protein